MRIPPWLGQLTRFSVVGVVNTAVYYIAFLAARSLLALLPSHVIGWWAAVTVSYILNARFTYRERLSWRSYAWYPLTTVAALLASGSILYVSVHIFGMPELWAPLVAGLAALPVTFLVARIIITRQLPLAGTRAPRRPAESDQP